MFSYTASSAPRIFRLQCAVALRDRDWVTMRKQGGIRTRLVAAGSICSNVNAEADLVPGVILHRTSVPSRSLLSTRPVPYNTAKRRSLGYLLRAERFIVFPTTAPLPLLLFPRSTAAAVLSSSIGTLSSGLLLRPMKPQADRGLQFCF